MTMLLGGVAAVSLVVGGIGIMNIMLVSVTERTREIGIRLAIGAQPRDVLCQFLVEAVVLSVLGGIIGILVGSVVALVLPLIAGWTTVLPWNAIALSFAVSAAIGMFFGIYPARKASQLDPDRRPALRVVPHPVSSLVQASGRIVAGMNASTFAVRPSPAALSWCLLRQGLGFSYLKPTASQSAPIESVYMSTLANVETSGSIYTIQPSDSSATFTVERSLARLAVYCGGHDRSGDGRDRLRPE